MLDRDALVAALQRVPLDEDDFFYTLACVNAPGEEEPGEYMGATNAGLIADAVLALEAQR